MPVEVFEKRRGKKRERGNYNKEREGGKERKAQQGRI